MNKLHITNTLTKKKEVFVPLQDKQVRLYACGVTPYDYSHIGHGRSFVFVDTLVRLLRFLGNKVTYVRNITDIDDKLLAKAQVEGDIMGYRAIARMFTELYQQEMVALDCLIPDAEPKVTEHIGQIIAFIEKLIEKKKAYAIDNDVYFDVTSYADYGQLSGKNLEELQAGARVEVDRRKRNPADFALWKGNKKNLFWKSPWGYGRPGWHIECSALANEYLGEVIDIHCGGMDLIFPHHENERAQSEALHDKQFARYWVHNALLNIDKKKMSKSLGNILSLKDIFERYDPIVLRFYFLQHQYRTPIEFSFESLVAAQTAYKKLNFFFEEYEPKKITSEAVSKYSVLQEMVDAVCDDLNTPKMMGILFENLPAIRANDELAGLVKYFLQQVMGLPLVPLKNEIEITPEIKDLIKKREKARKEKNWAIADQIRAELMELGYEVHDKKTS